MNGQDSQMIASVWPGESVSVACPNSLNSHYIEDPMRKLGFDNAIQLRTVAEL